jgi:hypothetical protein
MELSGLRGWGMLICVLLAFEFVIGTLTMICRPSFINPLGWIGVVLDGMLLWIMWESVKKIGR